MSLLHLFADSQSTDSTQMRLQVGAFRLHGRDVHVSICLVLSEDCKLCVPYVEQHDRIEITLCAKCTAHNMYIGPCHNWLTILKILHPM